MKIGKIIRKKRRDLDMSQAELAKKIGVSKCAISTWEVGRAEPKFLPGYRALKVLGLNFDDLDVVDFFDDDQEDIDKEDIDKECVLRGGGCQ